MNKHPIQPTELINGVIRFKENKIVSYLLDKGGIDLNRIAREDFSQEDREQFAQLIGYSLSGFGDLQYASDVTLSTAEVMADSGKPEIEAKVEFLEAKLNTVKDSVREAATHLFGIHPDDLV